MLSYEIDPIAKLLGDWSYSINIYSILLRIGIALIIGSIIGCERANKRHSAGLRTFIIIVLGSTIAMMLDLYIGQTYTTTLGFFIPAAVIVGVAILSANTMLYTSRSQIKGLTTSVALWASSILGLTLGAGCYTITIISFVVTILCLSQAPAFERYLKNRSNHFEIHLELKNASYLKDFTATLRKLGIMIDDIESNPAYLNSGLSVYSISLSIYSEELKKYKTHKEIIEALKSLEYVYFVEEMN